MIRNYKKEFDTIRRNAIDLVKYNFKGLENFTMYMSFTKYGKSLHEKENKKFLDDTELDHELGILDDDEYNRLKMAHNIIERSIANGSLY